MVTVFYHGEVCLKQPLKTELKLPQKYTHEIGEVTCSTRTFLIGTKKGTCDICKATKKSTYSGIALASVKTA